MIKRLILTTIIFCNIHSSYATERCPDKLAKTSKYSDLNTIINCLNNKITHLENEVYNLKNTEKTTPMPNIEHLSTGQKVDDDGLSYRLLNCKRKGGATVCEFSILNNEADKTLYLYAKKNTRSVDFSGREYLANSTSIGGSKEHFYTKKIMVTDVPMIAIVRFPSVPNEIKGFSLVELYTRNTRIKFKNVQIN